ncbi:MAG: radical SAM protein [Sediminibacterium sp.]
MNKPVNFYVKKSMKGNPHVFDDYFQLNALTITVTSACNLHCDYCFEEHESRMIKPDEIIPIIDIAFNNFRKNNPEGPMPLSFFGGEPFIAWKTIKNCIEHAKEKGYELSVGITTNLTLLTDEQIEFLDDNDIGLLVSIDGTKEVHDRLRDGSYDVVANNVKKLIDSGLKRLIEARMTVPPSDFGNLLAGVQNIFSLGVENIAPVPVTDQKWTQEQIDTLKDQLDKLYEWTISIYENEDNKRNISIKMLDDYLFQCIHDEYDMRGTPCSFGSNQWLSIGPSGEMYPCHQIHTRKDQQELFYMGNIIQGEILPHKILGQVVPHSWKKAEDPKYTCDTCEAYNICRGSCPSENYDLNKNYLMTPDEWCEWVRMARNVALKYQNKILNSKNIRNKRLNVMKVNLQLIDVSTKIFRCDISSREFPMILLDFYERVLSAEHILLPGFKELLFKKVDNFKQQLIDLQKKLEAEENGIN